MTVQNLIKTLEKAMKEVGPRAKVVIDLTEFRLIHEDYSHWEAHTCETESIRWEKDGSYELANGEERIRGVVVIK